MNDFLMFFGFFCLVVAVWWLIEVLVKSLQIELLTKIITMLKNLVIAVIQGYGIYYIWQIIRQYL